MNIKITKWQHPTANIPVRYYVNGLDVPGAVKVWIEQTKAGKISIHSNPDIQLKMSALLEKLNESNLITLQEAGNPPKDLFERLANNASSSKPQSQPSPTRQMMQQKSEPVALDMPVTLTVDHREPDDLIKALQAIEGVTINKAVLNVGDVCFEGGIIERKTAVDFAQSIQDRRLFTQSDQLSAMSSMVIKAIIVEGNYYQGHGFHQNSIDGAISYLSVLQGLTVIHSHDIQHTANLIAKMACHAAHGLGYEVSYREAKPKNINVHAVYFLQGLPGIGVENAKLLLRHFGSLSAVLNASESEFLAVKGIGKKTTEAIRNLLNHTWEENS